VCVFVMVCVPIGSWPALAPLAAALGKEEAVCVSHGSLFFSGSIIIKGPSRSAGGGWRGPFMTKSLSMSDMFWR
jgi:hypothetical protein